MILTSAHIVLNQSDILARFAILLNIYRIGQSKSVWYSFSNELMIKFHGVEIEYLNKTRKEMKKRERSLLVNFFIFLMKLNRFGRNKMCGHRVGEKSICSLLCMSQIVLLKSKS